MSRTLIVYGTRFGATAKSSEIIAKVLSDKFNHDVEVANLAEQKGKIDLAPYDNIIIGSSIAYFSWKRRAKKFLRNDFTGKKLFVFITSAALTYAALEEGDIEKYEKWKRRFLDNVIKNKTNIEPSSTAVFGGWIKKGDDFDLYNWKEADATSWAEKIGELTN
jgi:menaquinone-dependent protoporphyrinogen IX oxidase